MVDHNVLSPKLKVAFLNVGQGDTIVVSCPATQEAIVVDCNDGNIVLDYLTHEHIRYLRGLIITHFHADHYAGAIDLLSNWQQVPSMGECELVLYNSLGTTSTKVADRLLCDQDGHSLYSQTSQTIEHQKGILDKLLEWCKRTRRAKPAISESSNPFSGFLGTKIDILYPHHSDLDVNPIKYKGNINNLSVIIRVRGSGSSALLTGDIEPFGWERLLSSTHLNLQSDVFKFPHHGSWKLSKHQLADVDILLNKVNPSIVIMSVGTDDGINKKYSHPNAHVFEALQKRSNVSLLCTQATSQCASNVLSIRAEVNQVLDSHPLNGINILPQSQNGCACAGHIVVELGDEAEIIQPISSFHKTSIINAFFNQAKCHKVF